MLLQSQGVDLSAVEVVPIDRFKEAATTQNPTRISVAEMSDEFARDLVLSGWDVHVFHSALRDMPPELWWLFDGSGHGGQGELRVDRMRFRGMWFEFTLVDYGVADPRGRGAEGGPHRKPPSVHSTQRPEGPW